MNKANYTRKDPIHLYNPKKEGWISYDINYKNALRKIREETEKNKKFNVNEERYVA